MTEDKDKILGLDSLDFMEDNGGEFFLTTEDKATYVEADELSNIIDQLKDFNPNLEGFTFEELEEEVLNELDSEVRMLIAEYEKELAVWQEAQSEETSEWRKNNPKKLKKSKKREKNVFKGLTF